MTTEIFNCIDGDAITLIYDPSGISIATNRDCDYGACADENEPDFNLNMGGQQTHQQEEVDEPAWNFRVWDSSKHLARLLEPTLRNQLDEAGQPFSANISRSMPTCIIELGAGTGLPSMVAIKQCLKCNYNCSVSRIIASELPRALPLLYHNLISNFDLQGPTELSSQSGRNDSTIDSLNQNLTCPGGHALCAVTLDSDEYTCSVCDADLDEGVVSSRCARCNFDLCHTYCLPLILAGPVAAPGVSGWDSLPLWLRVQLQFRRTFPSRSLVTNVIDGQYATFCQLLSTQSHACGVSSCTSTEVWLAACDWTSSSHLQSLTSLTRTSPQLRSTSVTDSISESAQMSVWLLCSDLTYSAQSTHALLIFLQEFVAALVSTAAEQANNIDYRSVTSLRILLTHQARSQATSQLLLDGLQQWQSKSSSRLRYKQSLLGSASQTIPTGAASDNDLTGQFEDDDEELGRSLAGQSSIESDMQEGSVYLIDIDIETKFINYM